MAAQKKEWIDWKKKKKKVKKSKKPPETVDQFLARGGKIETCPPAGSPLLKGRPVPYNRAK